VGKTSVARELVERGGGVHLHSDDFLGYLEPCIPPHLPESHDQNITVVNALARAAAAYAEGGYAVYLDGVIGPWFLPRYARALVSYDVPTHYMVLRVPLELALSRVHARGDHEIDDVVRQMHASFADLEDLENHVVDAQPNIRTLADTLSAALGHGDYRLDLSQVASRPGI
jgi:predicted kinase